MRALITGGAGFIGSALVRRYIETTSDDVLVLDKLTYAGNLDSLALVCENSHYSFLRADVCDGTRVALALAEFRPDVVFHLAAESHVDRSIDGPAAFVQTNVVGTFVMLNACLDYWRNQKSNDFKFIHVSTDEVFGSLGVDGLFHEKSPYAPNSPYSATKASSDHLVRAWHETYGLPTIITNCSNNYGPYHFPEKLIPLMILNALEEKPLPVYGTGQNIRDWLYVDDHARALMLVAREGIVGESYNVGGRNELKNIDVVGLVCDILDRLRPRANGGSRQDLIHFVTDRPGHDQRYAIDCSKIERELGWAPQETFATGLAKTVQWYLDNPQWWQAIRAGTYRGERLGVTAGA